MTQKTKRATKGKKAVKKAKIKVRHLTPRRVPPTVNTAEGASQGVGGVGEAATQGVPSS